ncbi:RecB family exonuclease [Rhodococcus gannanensis]|uniref:RecB family exonuclease n=1 Tax=Rhodococcus gannanensis TaxID=1960308 RepID=A0ABW4P631_9NOCA
MSSPATTPPAESDDGEAPTRSRPALSPSRAADFRQCPLLYRFRAVDRLPERKTVAQVRGTLVHAALEALFGLPAPDRVPAIAQSLVEPAWGRMVEQEPDVADVVSDAELDEFLDDARRIVEDYFRLENPTSFDAEACEVRVETELPDGVPLRGFVDRIDVAPTGEVRIVDYKTGRAPREGFERAALFQMKFYALMLLQTRGVLASQLRLLYLADGEILTYAPDRDELDRFGGTLGALWRAVLEAGRTGEFEPSPGPMCRFCDHQSVCPAFGGTPPPYPGWPVEAA